MEVMGAGAGATPTLHDIDSAWSLVADAILAAVVPVCDEARPPMAGETVPLLHPTPLLVGREREQAALRDALAAALAGQGSPVLIGGEAGIGKTALAEVLLTEAAAGGALVLVGRCYDLSETPPYGPWRELFARAPAADDLPALPAAV